MRWFRFYDDALDDPKVQQLSPVLFKHWVNILCLASKNDPRGLLPPVNDISFRLRLSVPRTQAVLRNLVDAGLLDEVADALSPHNWNGRQAASDDVRKRVQLHRERQEETLHETLPERSGIAPDIDIEKDREVEVEENPPSPPPKPNPEPPGFVEFFWNSFPKKEDRKLAVDQWRRLAPDDALMEQIYLAIEAQKQGRKWQEGFVKAPHRWLRDKNWLDEVELPRTRSPNGTVSRADQAARAKLLDALGVPHDS